MNGTRLTPHGSRWRIDALLLDAGRLQVASIIVSSGVCQGLLRQTVLGAERQHCLGPFRIEHRLPEEAGLVIDVDVVGLRSVAASGWLPARKGPGPGPIVTSWCASYAPSPNGVEAMYDPKNRPIVEAILVANASGMTPELAAHVPSNDNKVVNIEGVNRIVENPAPDNAPSSTSASLHRRSSVNSMCRVRWSARRKAWRLRPTKASR